jgi:hypothetical protein
VDSIERFAVEHSASDPRERERRREASAAIVPGCTSGTAAPDV